MHVWLDTPVVTSDGTGVGQVSKLVVHPASWKVLTVIVRRRQLFGGSEISVPLDLVQRASSTGVTLQIDRVAYQRLSRARSGERQRPAREWLTPLGWPPRRVYWPAGYQGPIYPVISARQLRGWGTLRATGWNSGLSTAPAGLPNPAVVEETREPSDRISRWAADRLEVEAAREQRRESLLDVDPYDVLARYSECGFTTAFERDDASVINPQPRPET